MNININRPMTLGQLAQYYTANGQDPSRVEAQGMGRGHDFIRSEASRMGIENPALHFTRMRNEAMMAGTPTLPEQLAMRAAGKFAPGTLPAALARRDAAAELLPGGTATDQTKLASLQFENRLARTPIPGMSAETPELSPLEEIEMTRRGYTPDQWMFQKRLGDDLANELSRGGGREAKSFTKPISFNRNVTADDLTADPRFSGLLQRSPEKARMAFKAIIGQDFDDFNKIELAKRGSRVKEGVDFFSRGLQEGLFTIDKHGNPKQRQRVTDPTTGKLALGSEYGDLDEYSRGMWPDVKDRVIGDDMIRLAQLRAKADSSATSSAANVAQIQSSAAQGTPQVFQSGAFARLQKTNPAMARSMWEEWQRTQNPQPVSNVPAMIRTGY